MDGHHAHALSLTILCILCCSCLVAIPGLERDQLAMAKLYDFLAPFSVLPPRRTDWLTTLPAVVVDDWLYIDGGQLYTDNGTVVRQYYRETPRRTYHHP